MEAPKSSFYHDEIGSSHSTLRKRVDSTPLPTDSLVTIPLSDADQTRPPTITSDIQASARIDSVTSQSEQRESWRNSDGSLEELDHDKDSDSSEMASLAEEMNSHELCEHSSSPFPNERGRSESTSSTGSSGVDWEKLDKSEAREDADTDSDEQTRLLLARLEQENNAIATDPKAGVQTTRITSHSRPPSIHQLKKLVQEQGARSVRFSLLPAAATMTELDFWAALVRDYQQTAHRLPTVTSNKIRAGIPTPLRGVVWVSMAGAREVHIEEHFDRLCGESSPYENIISKDLGRSFPGVEMFRDPAGEGQNMLGRVLKCFSLYDDKIGYCQGLGFLVGPLLMNMGEKQAFCVLVRLMEDYDLRSCFLPDLSGLHLRIFQFNRLLHQHVPKVAAHLDSLGVEGAYLSQWFLSFFAVTCPLPLLFRIYDVIFAEGASETLMRVALALIHRNKKKLLAFTEFEDAMQLLLSRALWDPYGLSATSADDMVSDFVSFTSVVTRDSLQALEDDFKKAQTGESGAKANFLPGVSAAASRFLGRMFTSSHANTPSKSNVLSTGLGPPYRPSSTLSRSPSKQSLATMSSTDGSSGDTSSTAMTEMTESSADSSVECASLKSTKSIPNDSNSTLRLNVHHTDKDLHSQIEDLLIVLGEMQREHVLLANQLQQEREERNQDHKAVHDLVNGLRDVNFGLPTATGRRAVSEHALPSSSTQIPEMIMSLVDKVEARLTSNKRHSSSFETKAQLRSSIAVMKEELRRESARSRELARQVSERQQESSTLREDLQRARNRIKDGHVETQRLEKQVQGLRQASRNTTFTLKNRSRSNSKPSTLDRAQTPSRSDSNQSDLSASGSGLREFHLKRSLSKEPEQTSLACPPFSQRSSTLNAPALSPTDGQAPFAEDAILLELVNAKTAEAIAKQELEELKAKFEGMRKVLNVNTTPVFASPEFLSRTSTRASDKDPSLSIKTPPSARSVDSSKPSTSVGASWVSGGGGFFGWGKK